MVNMRAIGIKDGKGPVENLYLGEIPRPTINHAQALVKVKAFGLNRMDLIQREGNYPVPPQAPETLGVEFSGIIEEIAEEGERGFKKGDAVFGLAYGGAYAEYIAVSSHMLIHKPDALSFEECAGIPETWITALQAMYYVGEFKAGKSILWHAGASAVSIAGQQLSKANGASKVFATARGDDKVEFCEQKLGATAAFNTKKTKFDEEIMKLTDKKGVDVIIDFIGPEVFAQNLNVAAKDCRIVNLATLSGSTLKPEMVQPNFSLFFAKRIRYQGSSLRSQNEEVQGSLRDLFVEKALPEFSKKTLKVFIEKVYPWEQIQDAHRQMEANKTKGKLICTIS